MRYDTFSPELCTFEEHLLGVFVSPLMIYYSCCLQYSSLFRRGEMHAIPSSIQGAASITSTASLDDSFSDMYRSPPRPLPYDADPRSIRDGFVPHREKGPSHSPEESEPLRSNNGPESDSAYGAAGKWNDHPHKGLKEEDVKSSVKLSVAKANSELGYMYSTTEDEDVCPTCLEGRISFPVLHYFTASSHLCPICLWMYILHWTSFAAEYTPENPKIVTKCLHHFHLGCIYEWMERSESCPVCGKVTNF